MFIYCSDKNATAGAASHACSVVIDKATRARQWLAIYFK